MADRDWLKLAVVEFLGPFALVFVGVGAVIQTQGQNLVAIALAHGLAIGVLFAAVGHISGGAFNPAVTLGLLVARRIDGVRAAVYVVAQLLGGLVAAGLLTLVYPDLGVFGRNTFAVNLGVPGIGDAFTTGNAVAAEIVLTFLLMIVFFGVAIDHRTGRAISGLVIGLAYTVAILAGGAVSGAFLNPARAFGPAVVQGEFADHWVWWVGPAIGAAVAALLYNELLLADEPAATEARPRVDPDLPDQALDPLSVVGPAAATRSRRSQRRRR